MNTPVSPSRQQQVAEILKCGKDPVHFMKKYTKIQHPVKGLIPFETYDFQDDCVKKFLIFSQCASKYYIHSLIN